MSIDTKRMATVIAIATLLSMTAPASMAAAAPGLDWDNTAYGEDESGLPYYMRDWDLMEPTFNPFNTELGNYAVNWDWNQDGAEGVVYYLQEAQTQDFIAPNVTKHYTTRALMTGKPNGTYWYRVMAVKGELFSNWSRPDSITVCLRPINPDDGMGIIVHDFYKIYKSEVPFRPEKVEFFLNVPVVIRLGDDPNSTERYTITLRQVVNDPMKLAVLEISEPHRFVVVTENESMLDIDGDGEDDLAVQHKGQHENGQVYVSFIMLEGRERDGVPYGLACALIAAVLGSGYAVARVVKWRRRSNRPARASASEGGEPAERQ